MHPTGNDGERTTQQPAILAIGPAGENLSRMACLIHDAAHGSDQGGFGAVWGSKNLKAVSVIGTGDIKVHDPKALMAARLEQKHQYAFNPDDPATFGAPYGFDLPPAPVVLWGIIPGTGRPKEAQRPQACLGCHSGCRARYKSGLGNGAMCFTTVFYRSAKSLDIQRQASDLQNRYGINAHEMIFCDNYLAELNARGIIGPGKVIDCPLDFGDRGSLAFVDQLLKSIAYRNDGKGKPHAFGDTLADGVIQAAKKWGRLDGDLKTGLLPFPFWGLPVHKEPTAQSEWGYGTILGDRDINEHDFDWIKIDLLITRSQGKDPRVSASTLAKIVTDKMAPFQGDELMLDYSTANMYSKRWEEHLTGKRWRNLRPIFTNCRVGMSHPDIQRARRCHLWGLSTWPMNCRRRGNWDPCFHKRRKMSMNEPIWQNAAKATINAGVIPIPVSDTLIELLQTIMDDKEAEFIQIFTKPMTLKEIKEKSDLNEKALDKMLNGLMTKGAVTGISSKSTGIIVYRLLPPIPGMFEFTLMRGKTGEKEKKLARLFDRLFKELSDMVQENYDPIIALLKTAPPITRVIPVEQDVEQKYDDVLPYEDVKMIINKFDKIAVSTCYCRHEKDLLGKPCQVTKERENCFLFGQTAEFAIKYEFARQVSKEETLQKMAKAKEDGLVYKAFHTKQDPAKDEFAICTCCKCCCGAFHIYHMGGAPMQAYASYMARVESSDCTGCGVCEEMCPMEAINLVDDIASVNEKKCIGCGVCSYQCPVSTIKLERTGMRAVFVPPARR